MSLNDELLDDAECADDAVCVGLVDSACVSVLSDDELRLLECA